MVVPALQLEAAFGAVCTLYEAMPLPASVAAVQLSCTCALPGVAVSTEPSGVLVSSRIVAEVMVRLPPASLNVTYTVLVPSPVVSVQVLVLASVTNCVHSVVFEMHMLMGGPSSVAVSAS